MSAQERDQLARDIYEAATILSGYFAPLWPSLRDCDRQRWLRAADKANARHRQLGYVRDAGRKAA